MRISTFLVSNGLLYSNDWWIRGQELAPEAKGGAQDHVALIDDDTVKLLPYNEAGDEAVEVLGCHRLGSDKHNLGRLGPAVRPDV